MQRKAKPLNGWVLMMSLAAFPPALGCGGDVTDAVDTRAQSSAVKANASVNPDFDIRSFDLDGRNPTINVLGTAGGTRVPFGSTDIYAYVVATDVGLFAATSHFGVDSGDQTGPNDNSYHVHKVTLDSNNCVTSLVDHGLPRLHNHVVIFPDTGAGKVSGALTVKLSPTAAGICVTQVFDHQP